MQPIIIIDTSYLIYRSYFAYPKLSNNGIGTGAFFGFAKTVIALIKEYRPQALIFALDTPEQTWRHKEIVGYKAGRPEIEKEMVNQIPIIQEWCQNVTTNYFVAPGYEADDLICTATHLILNRDILKQRYKETVSEDGALFAARYDEKQMTLEQYYSSLQSPQTDIYIFSSDKDLYQLLIYPSVSFVQSKSTKDGFTLFGQEDFKLKYELLPIQWLDFKALVGDSSDNLKGIPGVGPKTAIKLLQNVGSLYQLYEVLGLENRMFLHSHWLMNEEQIKKTLDYVNEPKNQTLIDKIKLNKSTVEQTYKLATLQLVPGIEGVKSGYDIHAGVALFEKYGFKSLVTSTVNAVGYPTGQVDGLF